MLPSYFDGHQIKGKADIPTKLNQRPKLGCFQSSSL